jgi:hypothetical protein
MFKKLEKILSILSKGLEHRNPNKVLEMETITCGMKRHQMIFETIRHSKRKNL